MAILKRRAFFTKKVLLSRLKSLVGRIVALTVVAVSLVLLSVSAPEQTIRAQAQASQSKLKLQATTVANIDAESLAHLLTTALKDLEGKESRISDVQDKIIIV